MSYYAPSNTTTRQPAGIRVPGPSIPSPVGDVGTPRGFVDPMVQAKFQASYGQAINYRGPDGEYLAKNMTAIRELQQQLDSGRRTR